MSYAELTVDQGSTFESTIDLVSDDGAVINVAGYVFTGQLRKSYYSANATANLTLTIVNAANGNVKVSISAANTANIKAGRYLYDIKMRDTSNTVTRLVEGVITITPQVTR
jgi:uncharacterized protein YbcV (DUF1398 family)